MKTTIKAIVRHPSGNTRHSTGRLASSAPHPVHELPVAGSLEIVEQEDGCVLLIRLRSDGQFCGDTWHSTINEAKGQAQFEFGVSPSDWHE